MPPAHREKHFRAGEFVRDVVIGMADGLTVPFALAAGISGATDATKLIVTAGFAEIAAGSIAMGLGGYLAARGDAEHYHGERVREEREIVELPQAEADEITDIFSTYGLSAEESAPVVAALQRHPKAWVDFMMRFELGLEEPEPGRAWKSATTIAVAYVVGGLVPLSPYIFSSSARTALPISVVATLAALGVFGYLKARFTGMPAGRGAWQTMLVGGAAAAVAFVIARLVS